jgi:uncharacterized protein (TIGR03118 family)
MDIRRRSIGRISGSLILGVFAVAAAAHDNRHDDDRNNDFRLQTYSNHVLVSDGNVAADFTDPNLANGWGVAFNPNGPVWVAANGTGKSTLYDGTGKPQPLVVTIPGVGGEDGTPTGIVFAGGNDFVVSMTTASGTVSGPARFIFSTEDGTISGWAPNVNVTTAITVPTPATNANYKGLALGGNGATHLLYAADFRNNRVDVFDGTFKPVMKRGAFVDPMLPRGYAPFGIQAILGDIYVTYAKQDPAGGDDEVAGPGLGFVDVYTPDGVLLDRLASRGVLNAPWGVALAPMSFGDFGGAILVGNFGDGTINAFDPRNGHFLGTLRDRSLRRIRVDGLWGIAFGNGVSAQKTGSLYYAAGPNDEENGTYGVIEPVAKRH